MAMSWDEPEDCGSIDLANSTVDDGGVSALLVPWPSYTISGTPVRWTFFGELSGVNGLTPTIDVLYDTNGQHFNGQPNLNCRQACWARSIDGPWYDFNSVTLVGSPGRIRLVHNAAFDQDTILIAHYPIYTWAQVEADIASWIASEFVFPTTSSAGSPNDLSFYELPSTTNGSSAGNRAIPAAKLYGFKITNSAESGPKNTCVITCGVHAGETPAQFALTAIVEFLLGSTRQAVFLRKYWEIYIYPEVNPQGRYGGLYYSSPDSLDVNFGAKWNTTGQDEAIDRCKSAALIDTGGDVQASFDLHTHNGGYNSFFDLSLHDSASGYEIPEWYRTYNQHDALHTSEVFVNAGNFRRFSMDFLDAGTLAVPITLEIGASKNWNVPQYEDFGRRLMYALAHATERGVFPVQAIDTVKAVFYG